MSVKTLLSVLDDSVNTFSGSLDSIQKATYNRLLNLIKSLDLYADGTIKNNLNNIRIVSGLQKELEKIILSDAYLKRVKEFTDAFKEVQKIQNEYFSSLNVKFTPKKVFDEVRKIAITETVNNLTEYGISANYTDAVKSILNTNITSGGSYSDLSKQLSDYVLGTDNKYGGLVEYAKQITTDSINQYSAQYTRIVSEDLGLTWFQYVGSLLTTSRPFCKEMVEKRYFHISEVEDILKGNIDGKKVPLNKNTGLPQGMIEGTNKQTFFINRGGWQCGHQILPVALAAVPEELRNRFD